MILLAVAAVALAVVGLLAVSVKFAARRRVDRPAGLDLAAEYADPDEEGWIYPRLDSSWHVGRDPRVEGFESRLHAGTLPNAGDVATMFLSRDPRVELHSP